MSTRGTLSGIYLVTVVLALPFTGEGLKGQDQPPEEPPHDWIPTAINYENVPHPYPV